MIQMALSPVRAPSVADSTATNPQVIAPSLCCMLAVDLVATPGRLSTRVAKIWRSGLRRAGFCFVEV